MLTSVTESKCVDLCSRSIRTIPMYDRGIPPEDQTEDETLRPGTTANALPMVPSDLRMERMTLLSRKK